MASAPITAHQGPSAWRHSRFALALALAAALVITSLTASPTVANAASGCRAAANPVACENAKPGTNPNTWDINGAGDPTIQGFSTDISVENGATIEFKIDTDASNYTIDLYRTGWYQGLGARKVASVTPSAARPQTQPQCLSDLSTELYDCGNWGVSASWLVPDDAVSGVYVALLRRPDTGGESHIIFIVRDQSSGSDVLFQTSDPTWQAYNSYGGSDFYEGAANGRAYKISYNRPFVTRAGTTKRDFYFSSEFAQVRFMERNGYDVSYFSGIDTDRFGSLLANHRVLLSVGHDEYWSGAQRANLFAARDAGVNLQFLTGNTGYWRTRYEASAASGTSTNYRTLVSYKETWSNAKIDPSSQWTGTWRDPRFASQQAGGGLPENALTGTMFQANHDDLAVTVSAQEGKLRTWKNSGLSTMAAGTSTQLAPHTVGYESDEDVDNGYRPAGLIHLSTTVGPTPEYLTDYGNTVVPGTTRHNTTLYRAPSGVLVFSAGSVQWAWGLDETHDGQGAPANAAMQQAQVNLLADMGSQPSTLMSGLATAQKSTDSTAPVATVTAPVTNSTIAAGTAVTVTGTASDVGGVVAGVEVSVDGGATWRPATGTTSWSYTYHQTGLGSAGIRVRAIDDSANYPSTPTSVNLVVTGPTGVFGQVVPAIQDSADTSAVEAGMRFRPETNGFVSGVRFFKSAANTGTHTGSLWNSAGAKLASVTFSAETSIGWQSANFDTPVAVTAGQNYVVSYTAPQGHYSVASYYWPYSTRKSSPIAVPSGFGVPDPGVFGAPGAFPAETYQGSNYFVDVVFDTVNTTPLAATGQWPTPDATSVPTSTTVSARLSNDVTSASVAFSVQTAAGSPVAGATSYDPSSRTALFTPATALAPNTSYRVTLAATGTNGSPVVSGTTWAFTTAASDAACPCSLFGPAVTPVIAQVNDSPVTLGVQFTARATGAIAGVKFYKGPGNTGTHVGTLWSSTGQALASATFLAESASGWQTVYFAQPVPVQAGVSYTASYQSTTGKYSATVGAFNAGFTNGPLSVAATAGRYTYGTGSPTSTSTTNYFLDVVFVTNGALPPQPASVSLVSPAANQTAVPPSSLVTAVLSADVPTGTVPQLGLTTAAGAVAGTSAYAPSTRTVTFTPAATLAWSTVYTATVSISGIVPAGGTWSFTTAANTPVGGTFTLLGTETPAVAATADSAAVELGMSFAVSQAGQVTAIRFYKGTGNTGTHVGSLWSAAGVKLATVTFTGETATGWQTAALSTPYTLTPGERYVVSYLAPNGRYSNTPDYFSLLRSQGPLTADTAANGLYRYGATGGFPTGTWKASNYFVDVEFRTTTTTTPPTPAPVTVTSTTPAATATGVSPSGTISAVLSAGTLAQTPALALSGPAGDVAGTSTFDAVSRTVTFTPAAVLGWGTQYSASVGVAGTVPTGGAWSFTTATAPAPAPSGEFTLLGSTTPTIDSVNDGTTGIELGTAFTVSQPGSVTGIRFYKGSGNSGTHTGSLWSAAGAKLATVTFTGESANGWQTATLTTPVALTPGQRYVVSYHAPVGHYSASANYFATQRTSGPITSETATNGIYAYGAGGAMPTSSYKATSYLVDVVFSTGSTPPPAARMMPAPTPDSTPTPTETSTPTPTETSTPTPKPTETPTPNPTETPTPKPTETSTPTPTPTETPAPAETSTPTPSPETRVTPKAENAPVSADISSRAPAEDADGVSPTLLVAATVSGVDTASIALTGPTGDVAGESLYDPKTGVVDFTPTVPLEWTTSYTATVTAQRETITAWQFVTADVPAIEDSASFLPEVPGHTVNDRGLQVGTRFTPSAAGAVSGVRFYVGADTSPTRTGYLWGPDGKLLATVPFVGEATAGWQTGVLTKAIDLTVGAEYRVTVSSSGGTFARVPNGSALPLVNGFLSSPPSAGVYGYGYPDQTTNDSFLIDMIFGRTP
ncbi:DUF4082 domain-containing protein [Cryobacterium sp. PAMC25264]|uniref:DUF4082 domain-containing protein n=1 Tax=Cryobacterium sp. PAMC25264 TaxID=2861288 RepID=UPI001C62FE79|nr:DUF4082 domain-containing protein [Cryobacterium sp. PAMC25264]QYF72838.1 DUF4082 domain-containing protein [Cryobacterium sp. PAMC25264]